MRAICSHQFEAVLLGDFRLQNLDIMVEEVAEANLNALQLCVKAPGILYYPSTVGPVHEACRDFDLLGETLSRCHMAGLEFHAISYQGASQDRQLVPASFGCLSNPGFVEYVEQLIDEQCRRYPIDVFILDFIRFGGRCFCESCRRGYRDTFDEVLAYDTPKDMP